MQQQDDFTGSQDSAEAGYNPPVNNQKEQSSNQFDMYEGYDRENLNYITQMLQNRETSNNASSSQSNSRSQDKSANKRHSRAKSSFNQVASPNQSQAPGGKMSVNQQVSSQNQLLQQKNGLQHSIQGNGVIASTPPPGSNSQQYSSVPVMPHHMTHRERELNFSPQHSMEKLNISQTQNNLHDSIHSTPLMNNFRNNSSNLNNPGDSFQNSMSNVGSNEKLFDQFFKQNQNNGVNIVNNSNNPYSSRQQQQIHHHHQQQQQQQLLQQAPQNGYQFGSHHNIGINEDIEKDILDTPQNNRSQNVSFRGEPTFSKPDFNFSANISNSTTTSGSLSQYDSNIFIKNLDEYIDYFTKSAKENYMKGNIINQNNISQNSSNNQNSIQLNNKAVKEIYKVQQENLQLREKNENLEEKLKNLFNAYQKVAKEKSRIQSAFQQEINQRELQIKSVVSQSQYYQYKLQMFKEASQKDRMQAEINSHCFRIITQQQQQKKLKNLFQIKFKSFVASHGMNSKNVDRIMDECREKVISELYGKNQTFGDQKYDFISQNSQQTRGFLDYNLPQDSMDTVTDDQLIDSQDKSIRSSMNEEDLDDLHLYDNKISHSKDAYEMQKKRYSHSQMEDQIMKVLGPKMNQNSNIIKSQKASSSGGGNVLLDFKKGNKMAMRCTPDLEIYEQQNDNINDNAIQQSLSIHHSD